MAALASSANLLSSTEENATLVDVGLNQVSPPFRLVMDHDSSELTVDVELNQTPPLLHLLMKLNFLVTRGEVMADQRINNQGWWFGVISGLMEHVKGWFIALSRCGRPPYIKSVPDITSVKVYAKVTSGEGTVFDVQEVPLEEFYKALAKYPQLENMVLEELLKQTEKLKLCAALLKKPAEENKEEFEFPYDFLAAAAPVAAWGLTNVMSESTVKMFQDFPHKWVQSAAALAVDLGIFAIVGAWVMQKKSPFFSKCFWGTGLTFMFAGALFCQAPLLAQLL